VAGAQTKSKLKEMKKAHGGPSDKNCDKVNRSFEEVNMPHLPVHLLKTSVPTLHDILGAISHIHK
jgi:hypothetical protein